MNKDKKTGFFGRLRARLNTGESWLTKDIGELVAGKPVDEETLEEIETRLLMADVGVEATTRIVEHLERSVRIRDGQENVLVDALRESLLEILQPAEQPLEIDASKSPFVLLVTGVNGAGKTTTIGKLAKQYRDAGHSVMLAAGDTFRAAAVEQLQAWGERNDVPVIAPGTITGADPAAVVHDALTAAKARNIDILIIDTAGRLHTQRGLMDELQKVRRVIAKLHEGAPHETLLVVDGTTGQNALNQAREFNQAVELTGLAVTKLDGSAKGGVMLALAEQTRLPIRFIGIGEAVDDLATFNAEQFVDALLAND